MVISLLEMINIECDLDKTSILSLLKIPIMIRLILVSLMVILPALNSSGQENYYYGANKRPLNSEKEAMFVKELTKISEKKYVIETRVLVGSAWTHVERQKIRIAKDGILRIRTKDERFFPRRIFRTMSPSGTGLYTFEETANQEKFRTGTSSTYLPLMLDGVVTEYHKNGREKSVSIYQNNQLQSNQNWRPDGSPYIDSIFYSTDKEPVYKPGIAHFHSCLIQELVEAKVNLDEYDDDVIIGWVIMETGQIEGIIPLKGKSNELNQILVEAIAEIPGEWEPAELNGKPVRYFMSIPLTIFHHEAKFQELDYSWGVLHYNRY
jgi:hypothetical protein